MASDKQYICYKDSIDTSKQLTFCHCIYCYIYMLITKAVE